MDGVEGLKATARSKMRRSSSRFKRSMLNTAAPMTYHAAHEARGRMDAQLPRQLLLLLQRSVTGEVVYAGEQGGFHVLEIKPEGGRTAKVFLDAKTFLTARQEKLEGDCIQTLGLADWRGVEGVMFPFETRQSAGDAKYDALFHVQEVFLNEAYDDALFRGCFGIGSPVSPRGVIGTGKAFSDEVAACEVDEGFT